MEPDDIPDFIELAINYRDLSPRSHLEMRIMPLFTARPTSDCHESILCAEITASEALLSIAGDPSCLPFVLFDVRSPDAFNQCHLHSTMHLEESVDGDKLLAQLFQDSENGKVPYRLPFRAVDGSYNGCAKCKVAGLPSYDGSTITNHSGSGH